MHHLHSMKQREQCRNPKRKRCKPKKKKEKTQKCKVESENRRKLSRKGKHEEYKNGRRIWNTNKKAALLHWAIYFGWFVETHKPPHLFGNNWKTMNLRKRSILLVFFPFLFVSHSLPHSPVIIEWVRVFLLDSFWYLFDAFFSLAFVLYIRSCMGSFYCFRTQPCKRFECACLCVGVDIFCVLFSSLALHMGRIFWMRLHWLRSSKA